MDNSMACSVCTDSFDTSGLRVPRSLACGHTLCEGCINKLAGKGREVRCPSRCKAATKLTREGVGALSKNFALIGLINDKREEARAAKEALEKERAAQAAAAAAAEKEAKERAETTPICEGKLNKRPTKCRKAIPALCADAACAED